MARPLDGIRVAAFTHFAAGPIAAQYLGALGADVIKIESPNPDINRFAVRDVEDSLNGVSPYFVCTNRNQRSIVLDLKSEEGIEAAKRILATSDVLIENFRPGVLDKLGFGYEAIKAAYPKMVYCTFSAFDALGSARLRPGQDLLMQAASGLASLSGRASQPPVPVSAYVIDGFTAMQGVIGILAALRHRDASGQGQWVRADMMSTALYMMTQEASFAMNGQSMNERPDCGVAHLNQGAPYGIYTCKEGPLALSVFGGVDVIKRIADALGLGDELADVMTEKGLKLSRDRVSQAFQDKIAAFSYDEAYDLLTKAGAWIAPVRTLKEALADPVIREAGTIREYAMPNVPRHSVVTEPLQMSETPLERGRPAPAYGQHSEEILKELGYDARAIEAFVGDAKAKTGS